MGSNRVERRECRTEGCRDTDTGGDLMTRSLTKNTDVCQQTCVFLKHGADERGVGSTSGLHGQLGRCQLFFFVSPQRVGGPGREGGHCLSTRKALSDSPPFSSLERVYGHSFRGQDECPSPRWECVWGGGGGG